MNSDENSSTKYGSLSKEERERFEFIDSPILESDMEWFDDLRKAAGEEKFWSTNWADKRMHVHIIFGVNRDFGGGQIWIGFIWRLEWEFYEDVGSLKMGYMTIGYKDELEKWVVSKSQYKQVLWECRNYNFV